ncbi:MAG: DNA polymerase, partial [Mesosutterella sp.]|nr:DNA polymerase [Mesosutterella sp.]
PWEVPCEQAARYAVESAAAIRALYARFLLKMREEPAQKLESIYEDIELPTESVLFRMERTGTLIDPVRLEAQSRELAARIGELERRAWQEAGEEFNLSSPRQLGHILFEKLAIPAKKKTASGGYSTGEEVLSELAADYPLPRTVLEYRALAKLKSTYTDKLPAMIFPGDGRVHTTFGQATAVTGRLASSDPNLQNIPVRTEEGRRVREAFIAPAGCRIVSADYSQIELRIMAHLSGDPGLVSAFQRGMDVHRATASEVFGVPPEEVTPEQRRMAKVINFGLIYGMGAHGLAQNLGVDRAKAAEFISRYFARYPLVHEYMDRTRQLAHERGYVETAFGRRLWLPDIESTRAVVRAGAERQAINAPMQGTAADLIKIAMVSVQKWLDERALCSRLVLQVHDELVLEVPDEELGEVMKKLPLIMSGVATLRVPLTASVGSGESWEAAH